MYLLQYVCEEFKCIFYCADPNQMMAMQGMGDEETMMNLAIALSLNEVSHSYTAYVHNCL